MAESNTSLGKKVANEVLEAGLATEDEIEGCTKDEIEHIEQDCGVTLPDAYKSFLRYLGMSSGNFLQGYVCHYPRVIHQQDIARRVLDREDSSIGLDEGEFVFVGSQCVSFFYFNTQKKDPPVYVFAEGHGEPEMFSGSFSDWLFDALERQV